MTQITCSNCAYEIDEANEMGFCQSCANAYDLGYQYAKEGK